MLADVTSAKDTQAYVDATVARWGPIDVLFSNAGISGVIRPVTDYPEDVFDAVVAVNLKGSFLACKHALPRMRDGGSIIMTSSVVGVTSDPGIVAYAASKHGLIGLMRTVAKEAASCTLCPLYRNATQTVFGEGSLDASILFVGEQPGDQEDLAGRPFVGPAGQLFDAALEDAGIDRSTTYVTNAVKHFKFILRGKRRIHNKPDAGEIEACRWWLDQERALIRPPVTVALGATAARSLTGKTLTISRVREEPLTLVDGSECWVTVHPSFLLRIPEPDRRREERAKFVRDLKRIKARAEKLAA